jgi:hypothetical protein
MADSPGFRVNCLEDEKSIRCQFILPQSFPGHIN